MDDLQKIINGLEYCSHRDDGSCISCPGDTECWCEEAIKLLEEQQGTGCWEWISEDKYRCSECRNTTCVDECMNVPQYLFCPYCGRKMTVVAGRS